MQALLLPLAPSRSDHPDNKKSSIIGKGAFGTVYAMINPSDSQLYAVKELSNLTLQDGSVDEVAMNELQEEVRKLSVVQSKFVVKLHTSATYRGKFYMMMENVVSAPRPIKRVLQEEPKARMADTALL